MDSRRGSIFSNSSLSDLLERMRHRGSNRTSISRDASVCSNLSELNLSWGGRKYPFHRDDSVCSNLSDLAPSECSELSLDISLKDEVISHQTITYLADIEHELDDLKHTMLEMDEEVTKFTSLPNPYTLKTTFSDNSITSGESRPNSALEMVKSRKSRTSLRRIIASRSMSSESEPIDAHVAREEETGKNSNSSCHISGSEAEMSMEWDSPQHGWTAMQSTPLSNLQEMSPSGDSELSKTSLQVCIFDVYHKILKCM